MSNVFNNSIKIKTENEDSFQEISNNDRNNDNEIKDSNLSVNKMSSTPFDKENNNSNNSLNLNYNNSNDLIKLDSEQINNSYSLNRYKVLCFIKKRLYNDNIYPYFIIVAYLVLFISLKAFIILNYIFTSQAFYKNMFDISMNSNILCFNSIEEFSYNCYNIDLSEYLNFNKQNNYTNNNLFSKNYNEFSNKDNNANIFSSMFLKL